MLRNMNIGRLARWLPHQFIETRTRGQQVMLTFDDGPEPEVLPDLLSLLSDFDIKATFFCIGQRLATHHDIARRIVDEGHGLGNHSLFHKQFFSLPLAKQWDEILRTEEIIISLGGRGKLFRPPQGRIDTMLAIKLKQEGFRIIKWNVDSHDYSRETRLVNQGFESRQLQAGDIVLMHDDHALCCNVLKHWLPRWRDQGLQFGSL